MNTDMSDMNKVNNVNNVNDNMEVQQPEQNNNINTKEIKEFKINAFRFDYEPNVITVNKNDKVKISINNMDTIHGIRIPDLGISGNDFIEFTAEKSGQFAWFCNNFCGGGHTQMQGTLIVK